MLLDRGPGPAWPLPPALAAAYGGPLGFPAFPAGAGRPHVVANFVSTLDGVASFALPGQAGGGPISGNDPLDRLIMGLLRACADAIVVGAGTLRAARPDHTWTADYIFPPAAGEYAALRRALGRPPHATAVFVTGSGALDWRAAAFHHPGAPVVVLTTAEGAERLRARGEPPPGVAIAPAAERGPLAGDALIEAVAAATGARLVLTEGGPELLGALVAARRVDELFLTLAPQLAGRAGQLERPGLIAGQAFGPHDAPWAELLSARVGGRRGQHLYLRYALAP